MFGGAQAQYGILISQLAAAWSSHLPDTALAQALAVAVAEAVAVKRVVHTTCSTHSFYLRVDILRTDFCARQFSILSGSLRRLDALAQCTLP